MERTVNTLLFAYLVEYYFFFISEDAKVLNGAAVEFENFVSKLRIYVFRSDCVCACDANFRNITC